MIVLSVDSRSPCMGFQQIWHYSLIHWWIQIIPQNSSSVKGPNLFSCSAKGTLKVFQQLRASHFQCQCQNASRTSLAGAKELCWPMLICCCVNSNRWNVWKSYGNSKINASLRTPVSIGVQITATGTNLTCLFLVRCFCRKAAERLEKLADGFPIGRGKTLQLPS